MPDQELLEWKAGDSFVAYELCIDNSESDWERAWFVTSTTEQPISNPVVLICSSVLQGFSQIEEWALKKGKL